MFATSFDLKHLISLNYLWNNFYRLLCGKQKRKSPERRCAIVASSMIFNIDWSLSTHQFTFLCQMISISWGRNVFQWNYHFTHLWKSWFRFSLLFSLCSTFRDETAQTRWRQSSADLCLLPALTAKSAQDQFFADFNERKTKQKIKMRKWKWTEHKKVTKKQLSFCHQYKAAIWSLLNFSRQHCSDPLAPFSANFCLFSASTTNSAWE